MKKPPEPHDPAFYDLADAAAVQALARGNATPEQQQRAIKWIVSAAGTYDLSYRPDSSRATDFSEGKRWVGSQVVKLTNIDLSALKEKLRQKPA